MASRLRWTLALLAAAVLPACPLTLEDSYEIGGEADGGERSDSGKGGKDSASGNGGSAAGGSGGGAAGSDAPGGAGGSPTECTAESCATTCCGSECIDTTSDERHCGGCNSPCPPLRACVFGKCSSGWLSVSAAPVSFAAREKAAYAWTGTHVFIWGGVDGAGQTLDSGALYDPRTGEWKPTAVSGHTPSPRALATAVWTGSVVVVWAGGDATDTADYKDGARYDPATDTWLDMAEGPSDRRAPLGMWTGSQVLFWGGWDKAGVPLAGAHLYDPAKDAWTPASTENDPGPVLHPAWAWSGTFLYLYGGQPGGAGRFDKTYRFDPSADSWAQLPNGPSNRYGSFGAWDGAAFVVVDGRDGDSPKNDGKYFDEVSWVGIEDVGVPTNRFAPHRRSGWSARLSDGVSLFVGGMAVTSATFHMNGGLYDRGLDQWRPISAWPSNQDHEWGVGVWTGVEFFVWGGRTGDSVTAVGERYLP